MDRIGTIEIIKAAVRRKLKTLGEAAGPIAEIGEDSVLLGGDLPIDSLDLAGIIVELQKATGKDPFASGIVEFRTVGELADLFS